jgi:hypothetical protein
MRNLLKEESQLYQQAKCKKEQTTDPCKRNVPLAEQKPAAHEFTTVYSSGGHELTIGF